MNSEARTIEEETTPHPFDGEVPALLADNFQPPFDPELGFVKSYKLLPITLERGQGAYVWSDDGRRFLDMYAGHAVASTGHSHPRVAAAIAEQARTLIFYSNAVDLKVRHRAVEKLLKFVYSPGGISSALFANSGAEAVENALKMAVGQTGRKKIVAFEGSFHGRTLLAANVTGNPKYRQQVPYQLPDVVFCPFGDLEAVRATVDDNTAAVILEPVQSMAGCRTAPPEFFVGLREICAERGAYLVYDEVQTGIGRTGRMFFAGTHGVVPDVICLAKGIGSGVPLSCVLVSEAIAAKIEYGQYGATYGAGPLAMAAMLATLEVIEEEGLLANVRAVAPYLRERIARLDGTTEILGIGFLVGVRTTVPAVELQARLLELGVIVGTSDDPSVIRLLPPLTLTKAQADEFLGALETALATGSRS